MEQQPDLTSFGAALRQLRITRKPAVTQRDIANRVGCRLSEVEDWEEGRAYPTPKQFARLRNMVERRLAVYRPALEAKWAEAHTSRVERALAEEDEGHGADEVATFGQKIADLMAQASPPPAAAPPEIAAAETDPRQASTFADALRLARMAARLSQNELAELMGMGSRGDQIDRWERGHSHPLLDNHRKMVELLPVLSHCVSTDRNGDPPLNRRPGGRRRVELKGIGLPTATGTPSAPGDADQALESVARDYAKAVAAVTSAKVALNVARDRLASTQEEAERAVAAAAEAVVAATHAADAASAKAREALAELERRAAGQS
jgi:transcriptional regulator with XRE-family HTH domain